MVNVKESSVNMVPSKVEITLRKADQVSWGKLEDPNCKPEPEESSETAESDEPKWDIEDDDISDSEEEWAYDTPENRAQDETLKEGKKNETLQRKDVEKDIKKAAEERERMEKRLEEQRRQEEQEGYEDMPDLE